MFVLSKRVYIICSEGQITLQKAEPATLAVRLSSTLKRTGTLLMYGAGNVGARMGGPLTAANNANGNFSKIGHSFPNGRHWRVKHETVPIYQLSANTHPWRRGINSLESLSPYGNLNL
ncbi:hypothetical protein CEXT_231131 [Caerostris extrusa]|uniref:Uncharacterized protein n=1 Tax=Caerostris extrusa TaxID=172846 RepID=A0AAV4QYA2_CAEEX|nr:hypothetical protein CEXT_231131 [Caerostris extrusa]